MAIADTTQRANIVYATGAEIRPTNLSVEEIERYAEGEAGRAGFAVGDDVTELAERLGARIHYLAMEDWLATDASLYVHGKRDMDITLPRYTSPFRDRFTLAHELGHYFLHARQGKLPLIARGRDAPQLDRQANAFAAGLLMPRAAFAAHLAQLSDLAMASKFGLPIEYIRKRKESVGG